MDVYQKTAQLLQVMPLKDMDGALLTAAIHIHLSDRGWSQSGMIDRAILLATWAHRSQTRANRANLPRTPYIEHPLRVTLRVLRWGCNDAAVVAAAALHDVVEDCAPDICRAYLGLPGDLPAEEARDIAFVYLHREFGEEVTAIVRGLTNPLHPAGLARERKNSLYGLHVRQAIADPGVCVTKAADLTDNAAGLHHNLTDGASRGMVSRLAQKYAPVFPAVLARVDKADVADLLSAEGWREMQTSLERGYRRIQVLAAA